MSDSARSTKKTRTSKKNAPHQKAPAVEKNIRRNPAAVALLAVVAIAAVAVAVYRVTGPMRLNRALKTGSLAELQSATARDPYNPRAFYYLGVRWLQLGQPRLAAQALRHAADLDADDEKSWLGAAIASADSGDIPNGLGIALGYSRRHPNDANAHVTIADLCDQEGDARKALDEATTASRLDPSNATALRIAAREDLRIGNQKNAESALRQAVAQNPRDWRAQVDLGNLLVAENQASAATASFQAAARLAPTEALPLLLLGKALLAQAAGKSQAQAALRYLLQSVQIQPNNAEVNHQLGLCEMRLGHWKDARSDLEQARQIAPADGTVDADLITVDKVLSDNQALAKDRARLQQLTTYQAQKQILLNKLKASPADSKSLLRLSRLCAANGEDIAAVQYESVLQTHFPGLVSAGEVKAAENRASKELPMPITSPEPNVLTPDDSPLPLLIRDAGALLAANNADQAQIAYLSILSRDATYVPAYFGLGQVMAAENENGEAIAYYQKAVSLDPKFTQAQFALAAADETAGIDDQAILHYRQGLALAPNDAENWHALGKVLAADENLYDQAETAYKKAIALSPHNAAYLRDLADVQVKGNEIDAAETQYRLALAAAPNAPLTQYHLAGFLIANQPTPASLKEAGQLLQQASSSLPGDPMVSYWQGRLALQQGDSKDAVTSLLSALPRLKGADAADAWYSLSRAYVGVGNSALAKAALERSDRQRKLTNYIAALVLQLRTTPNRADLRLKLAGLYTQDGDLDLATAQYRVVLQADPGNKTAQSGLKKLNNS